MKSSLNLCFAFGVVALAFASSSVAADVPTGLSHLEAGEIAKAAEAFQSAFEDDGQGEGAFYLGRLFEFGIGVEVDLIRAANLYAAAASSETPSHLAKVRLGDFYVDGTVLLRDYAEAAKLYCEAADAGLVDAQVNCGLVYQSGQGVEPDAAKALANFERAAEQGSIVAINLAATAYVNGDGADVDHEKAKMLFEKGAEQGNGLSFYELARLLAFPQDPEEADTLEAYMYANLASVRGVEDAVTLREELEAQMTSSDILVGQAMARDWTQARVDADAAETE